MRIYYRICEKEETGSGVPRLKGLHKNIILKKCWLSLMQSLDKDDTIILFEDNIDEKLHNWLLNTCICSYVVKQVPGHKATDYIHWKMLMDAIDQDARKYPEEIFYLCNDDFLHTPHAMEIIKNVYKQTNWAGFVTPYDYPDRYTMDKGVPCTMFITQHCHWRTIPSDTGVTTAKGKTWLAFMHVIQEHVKHNSDQYTWAAYAQVGALCPIPGVSTHLSEGNMTPLVDWQLLWDNIDVKVETKENTSIEK